MTELRQRLIECLHLRGWAERTQAMYVRAGRQLAEHSHTSPDFITEEALRPSFLSLKHVKHSSRRASTMALCGITFFFAHPLHRDWTTLRCVRAPRENKLPVLLRVAEVPRLRGGVRLLGDRVCLSTLSSCGLRLQEGTPLTVAALDSARMMIHGRRGNGNNDRYVPWPQRPLALLRAYWATHRHPVWLFPAPGRGRLALPTATAPLPTSRLQGACRAALQERGLHTPASGHTLRHAWAPHVLDAGGHLRLM